jgi:hypothetical protein
MGMVTVRLVATDGAVSYMTCGSGPTATCSTRRSVPMAEALA